MSEIEELMYQVWENWTKIRCANFSQRQECVEVIQDLGYKVNPITVNGEFPGSRYLGRTTGSEICTWSHWNEPCIDGKEFLEAAGRTEIPEEEIEEDFLNIIGRSTS